MLAPRSKVHGFAAEVDGFFSGRKDPSSGRDYKPEDEISGSLKNLKPEKIDL